MLQAATAGGLSRLRAHRMDAAALAFADDAFDVATALEVLEHMTDPAAAARELVRVSRRFILASVPSAADDNPEHIQLFDKEGFAALSAMRAPGRCRSLMCAAT